MPLEDGEVIVWKNKDFDEVRVEWSDRCLPSYQLEVCRLPQDADCRTFKVPAADLEDTCPSQVITNLLSCTAYSFKISTDDDSDNGNKMTVLYPGFHRTQVDTGKDFETVLNEFKVFQNLSTVALHWRHQAACVAAYKIFGEFETSEKAEILSPDLANPNFDSMIMVSFSSGDTNKMFKQCRSYNISVFPILNSTDADANVDDFQGSPFRTTIFYFNEPTSPDDVIVDKKSANEIVVEWTHYSSCYEGYHVTVTRSSDEKIIFAGETRLVIFRD